MLQSQWLHSIKSFRLEFWLSLPILGLAFWLICGWGTQEALIQSSNDDIKLEVSLKPQNSSNFPQFLSIALNVNPQQGFSIVTATKQITGREPRGIKKVELKLFTTDLEEIETKISKELELSPEEVRRFMAN